MPAWQDVYQGISTKEAERRLLQYGANELKKERQYSLLKLVLSQFASPMIYILLFAMVVTFVLEDYVDTIVIGLAVLVNTVLGFWQEYKAERGLEKLAEVLTPRVNVMRDGERLEIESTQLVPGDLVFLDSGDKAPADGVLISADDLTVSEAVLTGESLPIDKKEVIVKKQELMDDGQRVFSRFFTPLEQRMEHGAGSVYAGSLVRRGAGVMVVVATGHRTEVGKIAEALVMTEDEATPLQRQLAEFSRKLALMVGLLAVVMFTVGLMAGISMLTIFTLAVAVAVSAIPEGLVVSLTAILAIGMQRILKRKALVRKLVAAEVLGSVSVICTDKTGTITEGVLKVSSASLHDKSLGLAAVVSASDLQDPMEVAMYEWADGELNEAQMESIHSDYERLDRLPFSSEKRYSATLTAKELFVVGAPELLLDQVRMSKADKERWAREIKQQAAKGYRLVGIAHRKRNGERKITEDLLSKPWYWLGYLVYEDKVRKGLSGVFADARKAGIHTIVITGDYRETALEVMRQVNLEVKEGEVMDGMELSTIDEHELDQRISNIRLFARTSPAQKLKIVSSLQRRGEVVAMTGDGVNDAPAVKKADIGIVVSGASDVSKETADMVLLDDNFETIIAAVEEGRGIFANLRKELVYLLSDSFSEMVAILGALAMGLPIPLLPAQILWINLVNDGFPNLALTVDPKDEDLLDQPPRSQDEPLMGKEIAFFIGLISVVTGIFVLLSFLWLYRYQGVSLERARTIAFALSCVDSLLYVFSLRSLHVPLWRYTTRNWWLVLAVLLGFGLQLAAIYVPFLQELLGTVSLSWGDWGMIFGLALVVVVIVEISKQVFIRRMRAR